MMKQNRIQQALKKAFPQFQSKQKLIDYYVSFQFPQKQMKMVNWWQKIIQFIIQNEHKIYITYQQLVDYVYFYNLKPTPLQSIINYLAKRGILIRQNQYQIDKSSQKQNKTWMNTFISFFNKEEKQKPIFNFNKNQKIICKKIKQFKKQEIKKILPFLYNDHIGAIDQFKLIQQIENKCDLDQASIREIFKQLNHQHYILIQHRGQKQFILFSNNHKNLQNKQWIDLQSMKFYLREQINKFESMVGRQEQKISKLKEKAKQQALNNNTKSAKTTLKQVIEKQKKIVNISTRKSLLENQLTQLQYNQMNKSTILLLEQSQKIYQQTMIDQSRLDDVLQKNIEMEGLNKETNSKLQQFANKDEMEDEIQEMFEKLNKQVLENKKLMIGKKQKNVKVQTMDIEYPEERQKYQA